MELKLLSRNEDFIRGLARRLIRDEHLAEDLFQETWLAAFRNPPQERRAERAWLSRVVRNLSSLFMRTEDRRRIREARVAEAEQLPPTDLILEREVEKLRVVRAVKALKEPYRSAIVYRFYENLPPREIARRLNVPVKTVKTRIHRALGLLRKELDHAHGSDGRGYLAALAPIAGLEAPVQAGLPFTALLKGVLAMSLKVKTGLTLAAAAVIVLGATFLLWESDTRLEPHSPELAVAENREVPIDTEQVSPGDPQEITREMIAPENERDEMPLSFREALGGFEGRVIHPDGTPAPDRKVELISLKALDFLTGARTDMENASCLESIETQSDENGIFRFAGIYPRGFFTLRVSPEKPDSVTRLVDAQPDPGDVVNLGDVMLEPGSLIRGHVTDESGKPLANARVRLAQVPPLIFAMGVQDVREGCAVLLKENPLSNDPCLIELPSDFFTLLKEAVACETLTATDGSFELEGAPEGPISLIADKAGYQGNWSTIVSPAPGHEKKVDPLKLYRGEPLTAKVQDSEGRPRSGVEVRIGPYWSEPGLGVLQPAVVSSSDGTVRTKGLPDNLPLCAAIRTRPEAPWTILESIDRDASILVFQTPPSFDITLTIKDQDGNAVEGARVRMRIKSMQNLLPDTKRDLSLKTTEPGIFKASDLESGFYEYHITAPGFALHADSLRLDDSSLEHEIVLETGLSARIRVIDETTRLPIDWAEVLVKMMGPGGDVSEEIAASRVSKTKGHAGSLRMKNEDWFLHPFTILRTRTDQTGWALFEEMGKSCYGIAASHPGYCSGCGFLDMNNESEVVIELSRGGVLEGSIVFENSGRVPPFTLCIEPRDTSGFPEADQPRFVHTDLSGKFTASRLQPGRWYVNVIQNLASLDTAHLFTEIEPYPLAGEGFGIREGETTYLTLPIMGARPVASSGITGTVRIDGKPLQGAFVNLSLGDEVFTELTDEAGMFVIGEVPPGKGKVQVRVPTVIGDHVGFEIVRELYVEPDLHHQELFEIVTGSVSGRLVVHPTGMPVSGAKIRARGESEASKTYFRLPDSRAITGADGRFEIRGIPTGRYSLDWDKSDLSGLTEEMKPLVENANSVSDTVDLVDAGIAGPITITLYPPGLVCGTVQLPASIEPGGMTLLVVREENEVIDPNVNTLSIETNGKIYNVKGGRYIPLDQKTKAFEIKDAAPGTFFATVIHLTEDQKRKMFKPIEFEIPEDGITDLVLHAIEDKKAG